MTDVLNRQYVFADKLTAEKFLIELSQTSVVTKHAMCLLSSLHMQAMWELEKKRASHSGGSSSNTLVTKSGLGHLDWAYMNNFFYKRVREGLGMSGRVESKGYSEGDAMAGLHLVSSFLFSGTCFHCRLRSSI